MMLSAKRYKVEKYIEMARVTSNEAKREHFIEMAEYHLELSDKMEKNEKQEINEWVYDKNKEYFIGNPIAYTFEDYRKYAVLNGLEMTTKNRLSKEIQTFFNLSSKPMRVDGKVCQVFCEEDKK